MEEFNNEINEMNLLLKDIRRNSNYIIKKLNHNDLDNKTIINHKKRQEISKSSWAKSNTTRKSDLNNNKTRSISNNIDLEGINKGIIHTKVKNPSFSINKIDRKIISDNNINNNDINNNPSIYDVKIDKSSKYKRIKSVNMILTQNKSIKPSNDNETINVNIRQHSSPNIIYNIIKGYSFPKSNRIAKDNDSDYIVQEPLNIDKANHLIYDRPSTPLMRKPSPSTKLLNDKENKDIKDTNTPVIDVSKLAYHSASPSVVILPEKQNKSLVKRFDSNINSLSYNVNDITTNTFSGKLYYNKSKETDQKKFVDLINRIDIPGPGYYNTDDIERKLNTYSGIYIDMNKSDSKTITPQLERKKYYEEKVNDVRDFHDNQSLANDSIIQPRLKNIIFQIENEKSKISKSKKPIEKFKFYNVNYKLIDKRDPLYVFMDKQIKDKVKTNRYINDIYYGPQLPTVWANNLIDRHTDSNKQKEKEINNYLLNNQMNESKTANIYLNSIHSYNLNNKTTYVMKSVDKKDKNRIDERPMIGPIDWIKEIHKQQMNHICYDISKGRDIIKYYDKNIKQIIPFNSNQQIKTNDPISLLTQPLDKFGADTRIITFDKIIGRDDIMGPNGEKPNNHIKKLDNTYIDNELDINYIKSKDYITNKTRLITLYQNDRYVEKEIVDDHIGGLWFKGLAEEIAANKKQTVNYDRMDGRYTDKLIDEYIDEPVDRYKDSNTIKYPYDKRIPNICISDPVNHPRFEDKETNDKYQLDINPNHQILFGNKDNKVFDMNKMIGRQSNKLEMNQLDDDTDSIINRHINRNIDILIEKDEMISKAKDLITKKNTTKILIDMNKQIGRHDNQTDYEVLVNESKRVVDTNPTIDKFSISKSKIKGGASNWDKDIGRDDNKLNLNDKLHIDDRITQVDKLSISNSKVKGGVSDWDKDISRNINKLDINKDINMFVDDTSQIEDKLSISKNKVKGVSNWDKDQGRDNNKLDKEQIDLKLFNHK